ncbi:MAG: outer membrane protein assembly factor BamB family protein [Planctomycetota bacterium]|jgi:outer membrane protein assembly factor BamB
MMSKATRISAPVTVLLACCSVAAIGRTAAAQQNAAEEILDAAGVRGGVIVHLGCGDGKLTAALRANPRYLVHGLDTDEANVDEARRNVRAAGRYGPVSIDRFDGERLPYADDLVNLLVAEQLGDVPKSEVLRVLAPLGVACLRDGAQWTTLRKPWPSALDEWSHFLHDASNNAVAADARVGPPRRLKWVCGPLWSRSHEFNSSLCAMVSAGGRLFYLLDEGLTSITDKPIPERWTLIARDAFNGLALWKRPIDKWGAGHWKSAALRSVPQSVPRLLVAQGDRVFVTLGYGAGVSVLDAATGETLTTFQGTENTQEIRCLEGILLLRVGNGLLAAVDVQTGRRLWEASGKIHPLTLTVLDNRVFYQDGASLVCLGLNDGQALWRVPGKRPASLIVAHDDRLLLLVGSELEAVSAATGESIWRAGAGVRRRELFVAAGQLWHWVGGDRIVGRDLATGEVTAQPDTSDVFTPGHHLRCYQTKGTESFLITPNRGVEFVSVAGAPHTQADWVRGACRYGVMPANGLLYVPPNPCFCYPGVKLAGFNALEANGGGRRGTWHASGRSGRLERGKTYEEAPRLAAQAPPGPEDWPTYRHDARRSGATPCRVAPRVSEQWQARLKGKLTPPVASGGRVYVADKNAHTLYALSVDDGRTLWQYTAAGRIDSPPSLFGSLVLFGGADGRVYCLRASDGEMAWRFHAAPSMRRIVAFDQLESPWRVHGSVLLEGGVAYFTAGRSSYLDGGIRVFGLDPASGKVLCERHLDTWARTREDAQGKPFIPAYHMEGMHSDVLVSQGDSIYLGQVKLDLELNEQEVPYVLAEPGDKTTAMDLSSEPFVTADREPNQDYETHQRDWLERTQKGLLEALHQTHGSHNLGDREIGLHVFSTAGFLDDSWFNRTYWMYSATWPGFYLAHRASKTGQLLVAGPERTYAVQAFPSRNLQSPLFTPGEKGYLLFADANVNEPFLDHRTRGTTKGWGFTRTEPPVWHDWVPVRIRGMVLAGGHLFAAGPPDVVDPADPMAAFEGRKGAVLRVHSGADGTTLAEQELEAPPVFDGLIAAAGRLLMSTTDGRVVCFGPK